MGNNEKSDLKKERNIGNKKEKNINEDKKIKLKIK